MRQYASAEVRRNRLVAGALFVLGTMLLGRMGYVQLVRGAAYRVKAASLHIDSLRLAPERGRILDCWGRPLTLNQTACLVYVWPRKVRNLDSLADILASAGLGTKEEVRQEIAEHEKMFCFPKRLEQPAADALWRRIVKCRFGNCTEVEAETHRWYPFGPSCSNVVGFVGEDGGLAGLEAWYDSVLSGQPGWVLMQREGLGLELPYPSYPRVEPVPGADITLTLDLDVQELCYRALAAGLERTGAKHGSAVVLDAQDGAVLALASCPSYDPARFRDFPASRYKCAPVCDEFEPGSSFKIVVCAAALESPQAEEFVRDRYDVSAGAIEVSGYRISDAHNHGVLDFDGLFTQSSNPGCAMLALRLDRTHFYLTAKALGFGEPVGIGLPGEATGRMDKPAKLTALRIANNAFGQGVTVTLLQLAAAYLCIANNGRYVRPYLVRSVRSGNRVLHQAGPRPGRQVLAPATCARMKEILAKVVTEGTGTFAAVPGVEVCGKTGTAQKVEPGGGYSDTRSMMSFVGFLPREPARYVIAVLLDEPNHRFASTSAGPVFREIGEQLLLLEKVRRARMAAGQFPVAGRTEPGMRIAGK
ncbi:MAG: penicillin-binding protein 2 [candidate division WOR-3 bacterium]